MKKLKSLGAGLLAGLAFFSTLPHDVYAFEGVAKLERVESLSAKTVDAWLKKGMVFGYLDPYRGKFILEHYFLSSGVYPVSNDAWGTSCTEKKDKVLRISFANRPEIKPVEVKIDGYFCVRRPNERYFRDFLGKDLPYSFDGNLWSLNAGPEENLMRAAEMMRDYMSRNGIWYGILAVSKVRMWSEKCGGGLFKKKICIRAAERPIYYLVGKDLGAGEPIGLGFWLYKVGPSHNLNDKEVLIYSAKKSAWTGFAIFAFQVLTIAVTFTLLPGTPLGAIFPSLSGTFLGGWGVKQVVAGMLFTGALYTDLQQGVDPFDGLAYKNSKDYTISSGNFYNANTRNGSISGGSFDIPLRLRVQVLEGSNRMNVENTVILKNKDLFETYEQSPPGEPSYDGHFGSALRNLESRYRNRKGLSAFMERQELENMAKDEETIGGYRPLVPDVYNY